MLFPAETAHTWNDMGNDVAALGIVGSHFRQPRCYIYS
jgi:hypothetical protein